MKSELEEGFLKAWLKAHPRIVPEREYKWHPSRKYRADFFFKPDVIVEIMGGVYHAGGHTSATGYHRDNRRLAEAVILGYKVIYFDSLFAKNWNEAVKILERVLGIE